MQNFQFDHNEFIHKTINLIAFFSNVYITLKCHVCTIYKLFMFRITCGLTLI